jgi:type II secretory pathway pseudopilin PulG
MTEPRNRGLTIIESLLTVFLIGLILVVVSKLATGSQQLVRKATGRSQAIRSVQWALTEMRHKVEASISVDDPVSGSSNILTLTAYRNDETGRLPDPIPVWSPRNDPWWVPDDPAFLEEVEFRLQNGRLLESVGGSEIFLVNSLKGLVVENLGDQLQIQLVIDEGTRDSQFLTRVATP